MPESIRQHTRKMLEKDARQWPSVEARTLVRALGRNDNRSQSSSIENDAKMMSKIDVTQDIQSMTTFKRNSSSLMKRVKKTGRPPVRTVNGKPEPVLLDAAAYRDVADRLDSIAAIRRGLAQAEAGEGRTAADFFDELEREL